VRKLQYKVLRGRLNVQESEQRKGGHTFSGELIATHKDPDRKINHKLVKITLHVNIDSEGCFTFSIDAVKEGTRCIKCGRLCKTDWVRMDMCRDCETEELSKELLELPKELPPQVEEATE
jgi:hypothetical protein